jgi:hypothetical protein
MDKMATADYLELMLLVSRTRAPSIRNPAFFPGLIKTIDQLEALAELIASRRGLPGSLKVCLNSDLGIRQTH